MWDYNERLLTQVVSALSVCPACDGRHFVDRFVMQGYRLKRCEACGLLFLNPQPSPEILAAIYSPTYFLGGSDPDAALSVSRSKRQTAQLYLEQIARYA